MDERAPLMPGPMLDTGDAGSLSWDPFLNKGPYQGGEPPAGYEAGGLGALRGALPLKLGSNARVPLAELATLMFLPWMIFTLVECLFCFTYEDFPGIVWALVITCGLLSLLFIVLGRLGRRHSQLALGFLCFSAVFLAVAVGSVTYDTYMQSYFRLDSGATYDGVSPSEPSSTHADASVIVFQEDAFVDAQRSVGYMREGVSYCVAPIATQTFSASPQYWAVGKDCCEARGEFWCGDAPHPSAHSGVVVPKGDPVSPGMHYSTAIRMAQEVYSLEPASEGEHFPLFLTWSNDAVRYKDDLWTSAVTFMLVGSLLHLTASILSAQLLTRSLPKMNMDPARF